MIKIIESDEYRHILQTDNVKIDQNEYFENVGDSIKIADSAHVSHRRDISTFLNYLMIKCKKTIYFLKAYHPGRPLLVPDHLTIWTSLITWIIGTAGTVWTTLAIMNTLTALIT